MLWVDFEIQQVMKKINNNDIWIVYDGEFPVCKTYCKYIRIREAGERLHLVDARQPSEIMDEITAAGLDIDQGMVVKFNDVSITGLALSRSLHC